MAGHELSVIAVYEQLSLDGTDDGYWCLCPTCLLNWCSGYSVLSICCCSCPDH